MSSKVHVRKDDMVQVISGDDAEKGKRTRFCASFPMWAKSSLKASTRFTST